MIRDPVARNNAASGPTVQFRARPARARATALQREDESVEKKAGPLAGVRILEIAGIGPGRIGGMML